MRFSNSESYNEYYKIDFIKRLSLIAFGISVLGLIINFIIGFEIILYIIPGFSALFYLIIYLIANNESFRITNNVLSFLLTVFTLVILNLLWFYNYGSFGPAIYFFVIIYGVLLFMWHGKNTIYLISFFTLNILALFFIEYFEIINIPVYETENKRIIDVYSSLIFYGALMTLMFIYAKKRIFQEYERAKKSDKLKTSFLQNISHEIRTPLNGIIGNAELIATADLEDSIKNDLTNIIYKDKQTLLNNIDSIIEASKIFTDNIDVNKKHFNFTKLIESIYNKHEKLISKKDIKFTYKPGFNNLILNGDMILINNALNNIIDNSIKFTDSGEITIETKYKNKKLEVIVKDTGIGIKKENLTKVFEPHYKIEDDKNNLYRGLGLGLFYVKSVSKLIGAKIDINSEFGKYTQVTFSIENN